MLIISFPRTNTHIALLLSSPEIHKPLYSLFSFFSLSLKFPPAPYVSPGTVHRPPPPPSFVRQRRPACTCGRGQRGDQPTLPPTTALHRAGQPPSALPSSLSAVGPSAAHECALPALRQPLLPPLARQPSRQRGRNRVTGGPLHCSLATRRVCRPAGIRSTSVDCYLRPPRSPPVHGVPTCKHDAMASPAALPTASLPTGHYSHRHLSVNRRASLPSSPRPPEVSDAAPAVPLRPPPLPPCCSTSRSSLALLHRANRAAAAPAGAAPTPPAFCRRALSLFSSSLSLPSPVSSLSIPLSRSPVTPCNRVF